VKLFDDDSFASAALARGVPVFLLVNPIEYHGPHLSLRNDHLVSLGIAKDLHAYLRAHTEDRHDDAFPFVVTRDLDVGVEPTAGPGSVHVPFATVRREVLSACRELRRLGAQKVVFVTFHGSPLHALAIEAGVEWLTRHGVVAFSPMNLLLQELVVADGARYAEAYAGVPPLERDRMIADVASDFHAGFFETSMALHYARGSVRAFYNEVPDCPAFPEPKLLTRALALLSRAGLGARAKEISLVFRAATWMALRPFPGYTGMPRYASPEAGAVFAKHLLALFGPAAEDVLSGGESSPPPPLTWVRYVTLNGRIAVPTPLSAMMKFPHLASRGRDEEGLAHAVTT